jgi:hypothetical protein
MNNNTILDTSYQKYVGWGETIANREDYESMWTPNRLSIIQNKITQLLDGIDPQGRPIIVPLETIGSVLSEVFRSNRPQVGSIYSRYIQMEPESNRNDIRDIIDRTINIIVSQVKNELLMTQNNQRLTIWSTLYGDFNKEGLRQHGPIKIRKKHPQLMMFNMNY